MNSTRRFPFLLIIGVALVEVFYWIRVTEEWEEELDWTDVVSEGFVILFTFVLLLIIQRTQVANRIFWPLFLGFSALILAGVPDLLDEFLEIDSGLAELQENIGPPLGMILIAFGLYLWSEAFQKSNSLLEQGRDKYRELSITDGLTGLYNSSHFFTVLAEQIDVCRSQRWPLSVLMMDLDDFKRHNDEFGHLEGDKIISRFGEVLRNSMRRDDIAFRYGGEEYAALLPKSSAEEAKTVAERIRKEFSALEFKPDQSKVVHKTVSIGVTELASSDKASDLVNRADQAMYQSKTEGKNRTTVLGTGE